MEKVAPLVGVWIEKATHTTAIVLNVDVAPLVGVWIEKTYLC